MKFIRIATTSNDSELFLLDSESYKEGHSFSSISFLFIYTFDRIWMSELDIGC